MLDLVGLQGAEGLGRQVQALLALLALHGSSLSASPGEQPPCHSGLALLQALRAPARPAGVHAGYHLVDPGTLLPIPDRRRAWSDQRSRSSATGCCWSAPDRSTA